MLEQGIKFRFQKHALLQENKDLNNSFFQVKLQILKGLLLIKLFK